ncbi:hypothetical protein C8F01DRAFT_735656 [Mycena amicta]|nr:hypothetical protein C8F01DRAFT_735656 [Mycena amicta]
MIEAGNLLESAWLGGTHRLAMGPDGNLHFLTVAMLGESSESTADASSAGAGDSFDDSSMKSSTPAIYMSTFTQTLDPEESHHEESDVDTSSSSSHSNLGSPNHLGTILAHNILSNEDALQQLAGPDRVLHVVEWSPKMLDSLCSMVAPSKHHVAQSQNPSTFLRNWEDRVSPKTSYTITIPKSPQTPRTTPPTRKPKPWKGGQHALFVSSQSKRPCVVGRDKQTKTTKEVVPLEEPQ